MTQAKKDDWAINHDKEYYAIYQIKEDCPIWHDIAFAPYKRAYGKFDMNNYHEVYCGSLKPFVSMVDSDGLVYYPGPEYICDCLFEIFNAPGPRPEGYKGWSLSMSDVIEISRGKGYDNNKPRFFYCDIGGWVEVNKTSLNDNSDKESGDANEK